MECHPTVPSQENRAGLVIGTKVSLIPGITVTTLVMGQVQGQARKQVHHVGIRRHKAGHRHGCGAAQTRTQAEGSKQSGKPLTRCLTALPLPSFDQGCTGSQSPQRGKAATHSAGMLMVLPVPCLTSKWR